MKKGLPIFILLLIFSFGCGPKPGVKWEKFTPELMQEVRGSGQPIIAYFYAAWCPPCYKLKDETYSDPSVMDALAPLRKIKFDLSFKHSPEIQALAAEYQIRGYPTVTFFDPQGYEDLAFRFSGFMGPEQFSQLVHAFRNKHAIRDLAPATP